MEIVTRISQELGLRLSQVQNTVDLLEADNTIPFISRYRKEVTGNLDEVQIGAIADRFQYLQEMEERRTAILQSIQSQGKLTPELEQALRSAETKQQLEDLYLPYKPKRRTRATIAREKGLQPLADLILVPATTMRDLEEWVRVFNSDKGEPIPLEEALAGARDILAETISEDADTRDTLRKLTWELGVMTSKIKPEFEGKPTKFDMYANFQEPLRTIAAHRFLALRRGEKEEVLRVAVQVEEATALEAIRRKWQAGINREMLPQLDLVVQDAYVRLLDPSLETDVRLELKEKADETSIELFARNLRELLLQPPGGMRRVMGLDPGFRTGTKWVVIDPTGKLLDHGVIYPTPPQNKLEEARTLLRRKIREHQVEIISIGNGTASREVQQFVRGFLKEEAPQVIQLMVNEAGASVYSASEIARQEFPDFDVTVRGAVSIARRYQDPLAELVKIDPKSIGVGQYQHDVNQTRLKQSLDRTVESCVNYVGVDVNTASPSLLSYVAGLSRAVAQKLVDYRDQQGPFRLREDLKNISGLGKKTFEQAAGFLRIPNGLHPLDRSAVHPENYALVERIAADHQLSVGELMGNEAILNKLDLTRYANEQVGMFTLNDILAELRKPGRDPRADHSIVQFDDNVQQMEDLKVGMKLNGVITNVTHFGAFVDVGVHQDGLVHISELSDKFVKDPLEVCAVGQKVVVYVREVDLERKRIALSMKTSSSEGTKRSGENSQRGTNPGKKPEASQSKDKRDFKEDLQALMQKFGR